MSVLALVTFALINLVSAVDNYSLMFVSGVCTGEEFDTATLLPAARVAIKELLLTNGRQFHLCNEKDIESTKTRDQSSIESILDILHNNPNCSNVNVIVHPGCAEDTPNIINALAEHFSKSIIVTYSFSSVSSEMLAHDSHFHMLPHNVKLVDGLSGVVAYFNWSRFVIITQNLAVFTMISQEVKESFLTDVSKKILSINSDNGILFPPNHRIFILNMYPVYARAVLCEAYKNKMFYPGFVWITYGWYHDRNWWRTEDDNSSCSSDEIGQVLTGAIALSHYPVPFDEEVNSNFTDMYSRLVYDAVWAYGSCINKTQDRSMLDVAFRNLNIPGISGQIIFNNGFRYIKDVQLLQYRGDDQLEMVPVASISVLRSPGNITFLENESITTLWPDGLPLDGTPHEIENYPLLPLMVVCYTYATAGICFAIVCFTFNIVFRNKKLVRLTSPNLNYFIIIGALVFYLSVYTFFYVPQTSLEVVVIICNFRLWLTSFGFSLCYIPINVKMWRVYHICRKPRPSMKQLFMRDWHLVTIVFAFIMLDLFILVSVTAITGSRFTVITIKDKEHPGQSTDEEGYAVVSTVKRCHSSTEYYWISALFAYKFILQAIGVLLAFRIRKVKIKGLNDSREVSVILYITTVITVAVFLVTLVFGDYINIDGGTYGLGISTATTLVLVLLFVPKMYGLYKDPRGEKIFKTPDSENRNNTETSKSEKGTSCTKNIESGFDTQTIPHEYNNEVTMRDMEAKQTTLSCDNINNKDLTLTSE